MTRWTESDVVAALRRAHHIGEDTLAGQQWSMLTQVPHDGRVIDVLLASSDGLRVAIEVKCSLADFRSETPEKRAASEGLAHQCYYAAPAGLLDAHPMPPQWGLMEVGLSPLDPGQPTGWVVRPAAKVVWTERDHPLLGVALRRASDAEEAIRRGEMPAAAMAALRRENERLVGVAERAVAARDRERQRAVAARSELLSLDGAQECADCGQEVTWRRGGPLDRLWVHTDPGAESACRQERMQANRRAREAATGAKYLGGYAAPVEPRAVRDALGMTVTPTTREAAPHV